MATFEEILARDGRLIYKTKGFSMQPMLTQNRDLVIIETFEGRLKPYDVALYKRGKQYVLTGFVRNGKSHLVTEPGYRFYSRFWHKIYPLRAFRMRCRRRLRNLLAKTGLLEPAKKLLKKLGLRK